MDFFGQCNLFKNPFLPQHFVRENSDIEDDIQHFHTPVTTSSSVLGIAFKDGVIIAADVLGSYGSLARFKNCPRLLKINKCAMIGIGGDYADFQYLKEVVNGKMIGEECLEDEMLLKPGSLHCWLTRVLYNRRSKIDPLWTNVLVGGLQDGKPFLGAIDKLGTAFEDRLIATGFGAYIAIPYLRDALKKKPDLDRKEAEELIIKCMEILYYRDARSFNKYEMGIITAEGYEVIGPVHIKANWNIAHIVSGYE